MVAFRGALPQRAYLPRLPEKEAQLGDKQAGRLRVLPVETARLPVVPRSDPLLAAFRMRWLLESGLIAYNRIVLTNIQIFRLRCL